jgi:hypothetical protein
MGAQSQSGTEITFPPNTTITVSMKFAQPRLVAGKYGERYMFTTTDDARFFVDPPVTAQIEALGVKSGRRERIRFRHLVRPMAITSDPSRNKIPACVLTAECPPLNST